jgi:hypothetical protein
VFELQGHQALVKSCVGRRGKADDAISALVVVLEVENVIASVVAALLGIKDATPIHGSFFEPLTEQSTREDKLYPGIAHISVSYFAEGKHQLKVAKFARERTAWLGGISLVPRMAGKFDVKFRVTIEEPQAGLMDYLRDNINRTTRIVLECDPGFDFQIKNEQAPVSMDLPLNDPSESDKAQLSQAAGELAKQKKKRAVRVKKAGTKKAA